MVATGIMRDVVAMSQSLITRHRRGIEFTFKFDRRSS
jgi:hypothetical protein